MGTQRNMFLLTVLYTYIHYHLIIWTTAQEADGYYSNRELHRKMIEATEEFPDLTHLYSIGTSHLGQELYAIAISAVDPDRHVLLRPETKYVANIHGNEPMGRELLIKLMHYLIFHYGTDIRVTKLLQITRLHLLPTMNPDGFDMTNLTSLDCIGYIGRENAIGIDLNRDFPDFFNTTHRMNGNFQPETAAIIKWITDTQFVLSGSLHAGAQVANYPYDNIDAESKLSYDEHLAPDHDTFQFLARKYSLSHPTMSMAKCPQVPQFEEGHTSGVLWYPAQGTMQDYNYIYAGCMDLTLELDCCKTPLSTDRQEEWEANKDSLLIYISQVDMGVKGIVRYKDGVPAAGLNIVVENTLGVKTTLLGEFWKLILPGSYTLKVMIQNTTLSCIEVVAVNGRATVYNITLPQSSRAYLEYVNHRNNGTFNAAAHLYITTPTAVAVSMLVYIFYNRIL